MYLGSDKPRRSDSPWRVLILVILIVAGVYVIREQIGGASWARPFDPTPTPTRNPESYFDEGDVLYDPDRNVEIEVTRVSGLSTKVDIRYP